MHEKDEWLHGWNCADNIGNKYWLMELKDSLRLI